MNTVQTEVKTRVLETKLLKKITGVQPPNIKNCGEKSEQGFAEKYAI